MEVGHDGESVFIHAGGEALGDAGDRPVVVLVHGAGNDHVVWRYQTRRLATMGAAALAVDLPGHGRSTGPALRDVPAMADWLIRLLHALGITASTVLGHSMGSLIAIEAARQDPDLVGRIGLVATATRMAVHPGLQQAADEGDQLAIDLIIGWTHTGASRFGGHPQAGVNNQALNRRLLERHRDVLGIDLAATADFDGAAAAMAISERNATPAGPQVEALVIASDQDRMTQHKSGAAMADILAAPLHTVAGGSHASLYDHPNEVNAPLLGWAVRR